MLKKGDWAEIVNYNATFNHVVGYVDTDPSNGMVKFIPLFHPTKGKFKGHIWIDVQYVLVKRKTKMAKVEWLEMVDWALDDRDQETFNELMKYKEFIGGEM